MLVLARKVGDSIVIGDQVEIFIMEKAKKKVTLAIEAPKEVAITRGRGATRADRAPASKQGNANKSLVSRQVARRQDGSPAPASPSRRRRRVVIEPRQGLEGPGAMMLRQALSGARTEVLESLARGEAIDSELRRALMELAREERRRRAKSDQLTPSRT